MEDLLRTQEMAFAGSKYKNFSGGGCPRTPLRIRMRLFVLAPVKQIAGSAPADEGPAI